MQSVKHNNKHPNIKNNKAKINKKSKKRHDIKQLCGGGVSNNDTLENIIEFFKSNKIDISNEKIKKIYKKSSKQLNSLDDLFYKVSIGIYHKECKVKEQISKFTNDFLKELQLLKDTTETPEGTPTPPAGTPTADTHTPPAGTPTAGTPPAGTTTADTHTTTADTPTAGTPPAGTTTADTHTTTADTHTSQVNNKKSLEDIVQSIRVNNITFFARMRPWKPIRDENATIAQGLLLPELSSMVDKIIEKNNKFGDVFTGNLSPKTKIKITDQCMDFTDVKTDKDWHENIPDGKILKQKFSYAQDDSKVSDEKSGDNTFVEKLSAGIDVFFAKTPAEQKNITYVAYGASGAGKTYTTQLLLTKFLKKIYEKQQSKIEKEEYKLENFSLYIFSDYLNNVYDYMANLQDEKFKEGESKYKVEIAGANLLEKCKSLPLSDLLTKANKMFTTDKPEGEKLWDYLDSYIKKARVTGNTGLNKESSRSHIFYVFVNNKRASGEKGADRSRFVIADFAGTEDLSFLVPKSKITNPGQWWDVGFGPFGDASINDKTDLISISEKLKKIELYLEYVFNLKILETAITNHDLKKISEDYKNYNIDRKDFKEYFKSDEVKELNQVDKIKLRPILKQIYNKLLLEIPKDEAVLYNNIQVKIKQLQRESFHITHSLKSFQLFLNELRLFKDKTEEEKKKGITYNNPEYNINDKETGNSVECLLTQKIIGPLMGSNPSIIVLAAFAPRRVDDYNSYNTASIVSNVECT